MNELPTLDEAALLTPSEGVWAVALMLCIDLLPGSRYELKMIPVVAVDAQEAFAEALRIYHAEGGKGWLVDSQAIRMTP